VVFDLQVLVPTEQDVHVKLEELVEFMKNPSIHLVKIPKSQTSPFDVHALQVPLFA